MPEPLEVVLRIPASHDERRALRAALLAARASELGELQRRGGRLAYGYGSESAREGMSGEVASRRMRVQMIDRLLRALDEAGAAS
jgi:hypothetical protein